MSLLLQAEAFSFLEREGFPVLKSLHAKDEDDAVERAREIGFPVTMKISSPDIIHKTEIEGVRVALRNEAGVIQAFRELVGNFTSAHKGRRLEGILVQEQGSGPEVIVGTVRDVQFGPVLMFGLGGIVVEAVKDISFRLIPLEPFDAGDMMRELRYYEVLRKPRTGAIDLAAVETLLLRISSLIMDHPEIEEMDLNPVFVSSAGVRICDARIMLNRNNL